MTSKRTQNFFIFFLVLAALSGNAFAQDASAPQITSSDAAATQAPLNTAQPPIPQTSAPDPSKAGHILPTAEKNAPATPTTQPVPAKPVYSNGLPAAPSTQPKPPDQSHVMDQATGTTQTVALPIPGMPQIDNSKINLNDDADTSANGQKKPYLPPELREKANPQSNVMLPPLYGWSRIVLNDLVMPKQDLVEACGMKKDLIFSFFAQRLQEGGIPLMSKEQSDRLVPDPVIAVATPVIVSMQDLVINCTSWVQFQITADLTFRVPPLMYRRKVPILLWHDGMMVTSAKSTHDGALINAFIALAMRFRAAWDAQQTMIDPRKIIK